MLKRDQAVLIVVDIQGKLAQLMHDKEELFANATRMIEGAKALGVPIIWTEQVPEKLGATTPEIAELLQTVAAPISKISFSCVGCQPFMAQLAELGRRQILMMGIEAHICVYQTTVDLARQGYEVHVISDAVSSRVAGNKQVGLNRMQAQGAVISSTEMALFELLKRAEGAAFKTITQLVK